MSMLYNRVSYYFWLGLLLTVNSVSAKENLHIAVASNFKAPLEQLLNKAPFAGEIEIILSAGASGVLYSQIIHGAPFDLFLSADAKRPALLKQKQLIITDSIHTYATGVLALWQPESNSKNRYIAIADPRFSPYGEAAKYYNDRYLKTDSSFVLAHNITQAFQFVDSGNARQGIVALASLKAAYQQQANNKYLTYTVIPAEQHLAITQQAVILKTTDNLAAANKVLAYLLSPSVQNEIAELGYQKGCSQC